MHATSPLATISPEEYAERVIQQRQQQIAAQIDPGYIVNDTPQEWAVGMVIGWAEETTPEAPATRRMWRVRHAVASFAQRVADTIDPTVRYL